MNRASVRGGGAGPRPDGRGPARPETALPGGASTPEKGSDAPPEVSVEVTNLTKTFQRVKRGAITPIADMSLTVRKGEFVVLLGPSGCGKTTLLRCIAGLETPSQGEISLDGSVVFSREARINVAPERRHVGMVFQSYALWPHMTVRKNVAYPLRGKPGVRKADVAPRVDRALAAVGVSELADQLPDRLSGGQKQRVSLARALVAEVGLILFDEPLSNVDARVRDTLRLEILQTHQRLGFTAIYVTHDQAEAMDLADRVAVLRDGHIEQFDTPDNVYLRPATPYVADFVGTANEIGGVVDAADSATVGIRTSHGQLVTVPAGNASPGWTPQAGSSVKLLWRPEAAEVTVTAVPGEHGRDLARTDKLTLSGQVDLVRFLGGSYELSVRIGPDDHVRGLSSAHQHRPASGDYVEMTVPSGSLRLFPV